MAAKWTASIASDEEERSAATRVTAPVKKALIVEARRQNTSINDVAVEALARHYRVMFQPSGRCRGPVADPEKLDLVLLMPGYLKKRIDREALEADANLTDTIASVLSEELGVAVEQPTEA